MLTSGISKVSVFPWAWSAHFTTADFLSLRSVLPLRPLHSRSQDTEDDDRTMSFIFSSVYSFMRVRAGLPCRCSSCLGFWSHIPHYEEQALTGWPVGTTTPFPKFITKLLCLWYHTSLPCVCAVIGMCFDFVGVTMCCLVQSLLLCFALIFKRTEQITTLIYLHSTPAPFP